MIRLSVTLDRCITLTTDFGLADGYVASMKGIIVGIVPGTTLVDVTHLIPPQDVQSAAFVLASTCPCFPGASIHVAVVDPGVGTERLPIAVETAVGTLVGPDNGIFAPLLLSAGAMHGDGRLNERARAVRLERQELRSGFSSTTFDGRDIFAPAAAYVAAGVPLERFGPALERLQVLPSSRPEPREDGVHGTVIHVDHFGNAITNIREADLPPSPMFLLGGLTLKGLSRNYQQAELSALIGSAGFLEFAARNGNAAERLGIKRGDICVVRSSP